MRFIEFARIHHWEEMLENACFRLENSHERFVNRAKMVPNKRKHKISTRCKNGKHRKSLRFPAFTHINLPGKCVFSAVNTLLYTGKIPINRRKTNCLQCVNWAVNAGKWFVYLHLPRRKTTAQWNEHWDSPMRKRTKHVGFFVRKTWVNVCKMPRFPF